MLEEKLNKIFKAYDIRGIYLKEIDENIAYELGRAFVLFLRKKAPKINIVVAQDNRSSSLKLKKALCKGIIETGANVIDIGLAMTPMFYFANAFYKVDGGISVTASHNPPEYNGFKLVREKAIPISGESGLKEIKKLVLQKATSLKRPKKQGKIFRKKVLQDYINFILKKVDRNKIKPKKIVIDTANAVAGIVVSAIFKKIKYKIYHLFAKLDGTFPNHPPNPVEPENLKALQKKVIRKKADFGIAFDGDGDRIIFIDENGKIVRADLITCLMAEILLRKKRGEKILYEIRSSNVVKETIKKLSGIPVISRVGHSFIKEKMRKENILFGGETTGHYYLRNHYFFEAPFFVIFKILEELSQTGKNLSELVKPFKKYFPSEFNLIIENKEKKMKELEKHFKGGKLSHLDGVRIDFPDWWFNVRLSQTEPLLRLIIEANTKKLLAEKKKEIINLIRSGR